MQHAAPVRVLDAPGEVGHQPGGAAPRHRLVALAQPGRQRRPRAVGGGDEADGADRAIDADTQAQGGSVATAALQEIADPDSALNRQWDEEHDRYVLRCLLELVELEFEPKTVQAFRRVALEGASSEQAAEELGLSVGALYAAKSRILRRLREEAEGLIDEFP